MNGLKSGKAETLPIAWMLLGKLFLNGREADP